MNEFTHAEIIAWRQELVRVITGTYQENVQPEEGADPRKYQIGRVLVFVGYNPDEIHVVDCDTFSPGDRLVVEPYNGCGMGIDVRRESDGKTDMVWPEEVEIEEEAPSE